MAVYTLYLYSWGVEVVLVVLRVGVWHGGHVGKSEASGRA